MDHDFDRDVAVIGAGRIGLPWAAVLAGRLGHAVTCVDVDPTVVDSIEAGEPPFVEPGLAEVLRDARESGNLRATRDESVLADHRYVAITINAPRNDLPSFYAAVEDLREYLTDDHVVINRATLPVAAIAELREVLVAGEATPSFVSFPERLAEGSAIEEIQRLPKIVGTVDEDGESAVRELLSGFEGQVHVTDPRTAMFVKLIDNAYRDALFSIANQIAYSADQLHLDAHEAIELANVEYPRNDIPSPGIVGGKCLPKDPHFLTDEWVCDQPTTPDLFNATRRTNAFLPSYVASDVLAARPSRVALLGLAYKRDVGDTYNSPAVAIHEILEEQGVPVRAYDPNATEGESDLESALDGADLVLLAVNHSAFEGIESIINDLADPSGLVYDVWGMLERSRLELDYGGFGVHPPA